MADNDKFYSDDYDPVKEKENYEKKKKIIYLIRELNANPGSMSNLKALMDYRDLRTEQLWLSNLIYKMKDSYKSEGYNEDMCRDKVVSLDKARREKHNRALGNFYGLVNDMKRRGIPPIYEGKLMDPTKTDNHYGDPNIRAEMTDAFLKILRTIEDFRLNDLKQIEANYELDIDSITTIKKSLEKSSHDWEVITPLTEDDGNIEFK